MPALIKTGAKLVVSHRRMYPTDGARYFLGTAVAYDCGVVKIVGRTFVRDMGSGQIVAKSDRRTKIVSLSSGMLFVYELPDSVDVEELRFEADESHITLVDANGFQMNFDEHFC